MLKVLVDHGCGNINLGDIAQLQGVLNVFGVQPGVSVVLRGTPCDDRLSLFSSQKSMGSFELIRWNSRQLSNVPLAWRVAGRASAMLSAWGMRTAASSRWNARVDGKRLALKAVVSEFNSLHLVGGGYLTDSFAQNLIEKCALIHAFAAQKKQVVLSGQQIGPFRSAEARECVYKALRRASFVGLREPGESADHCRAAGMPEEKFAVVGDDSFGMAADCVGAESLLRHLGLKSGQFIAINFRSANYAGTSASDLDVFARCVAQVQAAWQLPVIFVPISMASGDSDFETGLRLQEKMGTDAFAVASRDTTAQVAKGLLGCSRVAIGSSYHFCTFARSLGRRVVAIGSNPYYRQKAEGMERLWRSGVKAVSLADLGSVECVERLIRWCEEGRSTVDGAEETGLVDLWQRHMSGVVGECHVGLGGGH